MHKEIGKYRIEGVLGHGAMGIVYRGVDPMLDRPVAIKTIHAHLLTGELGQQLLSRFKTEATAAAKCQHANIVTVYDFGQHEDTPYIVMEFVRGQSLEDIQRESPGLPLKRINAVVIGMCRGINFAHQQGIVHRDIKPANVMVLEEDAVKIADFGIARMPTSEMTQFGDALGTPSYMSPEQRAGREVDARTDVFSIGVVIYELFADCTDIPANLRQHAASAVRGLPASKKLDPQKLFPASIATFFNHCLAADPDKRYKNIGELLEGYKAALQGLSGRGEGTRVPGSPAGASGMTVAIRAISDPDATMIQGGGADNGVSDPDATVIGGKAASQDSRFATAPKQEEEEAAPGEDYVRKAVPFLDTMRQLKVIDPVLNADWQERVARLMGTLDENGWKRALSQALQPKRIGWDPMAKRFVFAGQPSVRELAQNMVTPQLAEIAQKLTRTMDELAKTREAIRIADALEGGLVAIDRWDPAENVTRQKEKSRLREAFLYEFAQRVRRLEFDVPKNSRDLTVDQVRTFIVDVFIKQQLQGYWFHTVSLGDLRKDPDVFIAGQVGDEVKTRNLTVVRTDRYYFLIGSVIRFEQNQYSVRRFLLEDSAGGGQFVYFNGVCLVRGQLAQPAVRQKKLHEVTRIVTIQRQLSVQIIELVESFGVTQAKYLGPLLQKQIGADGTDLDLAVAKRLQEYEVNLTRLLLGKIPRALKESARNQDDFEYLFLGLRAFMIDRLADIEDFSYQSSAQWSTKSQEMQYRIASFMRLLEKRKPALFVNDGPGLTGLEQNHNGELPLAEVRKVVDEFEPRIEEKRLALREATAPQDDSNKSLFARMGFGKKKVDIEALKKDIDTERTNCFIAIVRIPKKFPKVTAYLEFEEIIPIEEKYRHYAFPDGALGVGKLPVLLRLPENRDEFDIVRIRRTIDFDVFKQIQNWDLD